MPPKKRLAGKRSKNSLSYQPLESRQLLASMADAGISQAAQDVINNVNGDFVGDIGARDNGSPDVSYTNFVLDDIAFQNTIDAIADSVSVPSGATEITTVAGLSGITAGTIASPNVYHINGDFTITANIDVPSNVEIYLTGSITYVGTFSVPGIFNNGGGGESENRTEAIFFLAGSDNVKLYGVNNARLIGNPNLASTSPHVNGVFASGTVKNLLVDGFDMQYLWQGVSASFGGADITVQNNYIHDNVKRSIWLLGATRVNVVHNFLENSGADGIDFDAYVADSVAYENVSVGSGRFAYFVEEGANNNFAVRQLSIIYDLGNPNRGFMLGVASNGTSDGFVNNNPGLVTRDNFFVDNRSFQPTSQNNQQGGGFIATGDNEQVGNSYFYGNEGYGVASIQNEAPSFGRDLAYRAISATRLPSFNITAASNGGFDEGQNIDSDSFNTYDLTALMNQWNTQFSGGNNPIRPAIQALPPIDYVFEEIGGEVAFEAEHWTNVTPGMAGATGKSLNLISDDSVGGTQPTEETASGDLGLVAESNSGVNTGNAINGPRADYDVEFTETGVYRVFIRTRAPSTSDNSFHVGLNSAPVSNSTGLGMGTVSSDWVWIDDVDQGQQNLTITVTSPGRHTFNVWAREDGSIIDKIVLSKSGTVPTGLGPAESPIFVPPAQIDGRYVFFNNSHFDGDDPGINADDDNAIDSEKVALLPGQTASYQNYTNYSAGINGIMIDVTGLRDVDAIDSSGFQFATGNESLSSNFTNMNFTVNVVVRTGAGINGSDRITLQFDDSTILNTWLRVTMLANDDSGLENNDVFYFGNAIGETGGGDDASVSSNDVLGTRGNRTSIFNPALVNSRYDFNKDSQVDGIDVLTSRRFRTTPFNELQWITAPS